MNDANNTIIFKLPEGWKIKLKKIALDLSEKEQRNVSLTEIILKSIKETYNLK